jgi:predicted HTH domain antitoxin
MVTASVRLPKEMVEEIERLSKEEGIDKGTLLRRLISESLKEHKIRKSLEMYRDGRVSLWKAAEMAGITYREALEELRKKNIPFRYGLEDLKADVEWAMK